MAVATQTTVHVLRLDCVGALPKRLRLVWTKIIALPKSEDLGSRRAFVVSSDDLSFQCFMITRFSVSVNFTVVPGQ